MTAINYGEVKKVLVTLEAQSLEKYKRTKDKFLSSLADVVDNAEKINIDALAIAMDEVNLQYGYLVEYKAEVDAVETVMKMLPYEGFLTKADKEES